MLLEFDIDGTNFRADKLSAMQQLHLSRKIMPLLPPLAPLIIEAQKKINKEQNKDNKAFTVDDIMSLVELAQPFADAISAMEDKDIEKVFLMTLSSVKVQTDIGKNVWMPFWIVGANRPVSVADQDFSDLSNLLPIVIRIIIFNLANFINGLLTRREGESLGSSGEPSPVEKIG